MAGICQRKSARRLLTRSNVAVKLGKCSGKSEPNGRRAVSRRKRSPVARWKSMRGERLALMLGGRIGRPKNGRSFNKPSSSAAFRWRFQQLGSFYIQHVRQLADDLQAGVLHARFKLTEVVRKEP